MKQEYFDRALTALKNINLATLKALGLHDVACSIEYALALLDEGIIPHPAMLASPEPSERAKEMQQQVQNMIKALATFEGLDPETAQYCPACHLPMKRMLQILQEGSPAITLHCPYCFALLG